MNRKVLEVTEQSHYNAIDLCKFIMSFAVIAIHTLPLVECSSKSCIEVYNLAVAMAVPFFFVASGYLLAKRMTYPYHGNKDILRVKKYLKKLVKLYLLWTLIYIPLAIYHFIASGIGVWKSILLYIKGFLLIGEQYNSWHLWYLLSVIYALILILVLLKFKISLKGILVVSFIISLISFGIDVLVNSETNLPDTLHTLQKLVKYSIANGRIFRGGIFVPIGMILAYKKIPQIFNWILFLGGLILNYEIDQIIVGSYLNILTTVGLFGIVENLKLKDRPIYPFVRKMSTTIYFTHMYIWTVYYKIAYGKKTVGLDSFIITSLISSITAMILICFKQRIKVHAGQYSSGKVVEFEKAEHTL